MGYMDISIVGSDTASSFFHNTCSKLAKLLLAECKIDHGKYNTPGFINAALFFEQICGYHFEHNEELRNLAKKIHNEMIKVNKILKKEYKNGTVSDDTLNRNEELTKCLERFYKGKDIP